jgi:methyl-accepting chemotaxis protein
VSKDGTLIFEHSPGRQNGKTDLHFDSNRMLKVGIASQMSSAKKAISGETGSIIEIDPLDGESQVIGFSPVSGPKWVDSIGWGLMVQEDTDLVFGPILSSTYKFAAILLSIMAIGVTVSWLFSSRLSLQLGKVAENLAKEAGALSSSSAEMATSSTELSEASTEQASAIQETAASIDEVSAMVKKNADNAGQSQKSSEKSRVSAEEGQRAIQTMIRAIEGISDSNSNVMNQVEESNKRIGEIVKVIGEIGEKTKVINDIVFQTKLLSFNASVEAARAGEHGKGFAVVAEEVGNLARMSGNAATEISQLLDSSIKKVEEIVESTRSRVQGLMTESKSRVESGTKIAHECHESLNHILTSVKEVDGMVSEISAASQEQSQGVAEINKAMNQLDEATQQNSQVAQNAATASEKMSGQASMLKSIVDQLIVVVTGEGSILESSHDPIHSNEKTLTGDIVRISDKRKSKKIANQEISSEVPFKKVVGGDSFPDPNDPRFKDI